MSQYNNRDKRNITQISVTVPCEKGTEKKMTRHICSKVNIFLPYGLSLIFKLRV